MKKFHAFHRQTGAVSLLFTAVFMMLVSLAALSFLYSLRYGHWPMQDVWSSWSRSDKVDKIRQDIKSAAGQAGAQTTGEVRRCVISGKVTYSNVECRDQDGGSRVVKLYDSKGIEAPKQPAPAQVEGEASLKGKMLEEAISPSK